MTDRTSAIVANSLLPMRNLETPPPRLKPRARVTDESLKWQQMSQRGNEAELLAFPVTSQLVRQVRNGRLLRAAQHHKPPRELNRLLEVHGLMGAIGEQVGLARTAEQDAQRLLATRAQRDEVEQRLILRATLELAAYFLLGAGHSLVPPAPAQASSTFVRPCPARRPKT